jgi:cytochrome c
MLKRFRGTMMIFVILIVQPSNHAPLVKIITPSNNSTYAWGSQVPYSVEVSDSEDGDSKFQEIQSAEVLVRLKYFANTTQASAYMNQKKPMDTAGLMNMLSSNCFSCHGFKTKLAGPSFQDINKKYPNTSSTQEQLVNHILTGSTGIWGKEVMPTHPELNEEQAQKMTHWILSYANASGSNYFIGLQSVLPLNKPASTIQTGIFMITAFYTDHGTADFPNKRITGYGQAILKMK